MRRGMSATRLRIVLLLVAAIVSVFAARLMQLQGLDPKAYAAKAAAAGFQGLVTESLPAERGEIVDRTGAPLADSVNGEMLVADPVETRRYAGRIATILADRLGADYFDMLSALTARNTRFQYLVRRVPATQADAVLAQINQLDPTTGYVGVSTRRDPIRDYPSHDIAANLLGFLNNEGDPSGGMELAFNRQLAGHDGSQTFEVGAGHRIPLGENTVTPPRNGRTLKLTIDRDVQWYTQRVLRNAVLGAQADSGSAVVLDTQTGDILGLADFPTYDADKPGTAKSSDLGAASLSNVYEPGSVQKVVTVSSLLDAHKVTPLTQISVPPLLKVADRSIHDWFPHGHIDLTMTGVIAKSSNIGTIIAAQQFSHQQLYDRLRAFGLGVPLSLGLGGVSAGIVPAWQTWSNVSQANIAFGQGLAVNAVQMAAAVNTVANGGMYVTPSLISGATRNDAGQLVGSATSARHRAISPQAAATMAHMMEMVTNKNTGTAPGAMVPGYRVAGKTGTAQRVGAKCGCYDGTFTVSFAGFAPADKPRFTVYVVVQNPRNGGGGGSVGGPAFEKIMSYLLSKYAVPPTGTPAPNLPIYWGSDASLNHSGG